MPFSCELDFGDTYVSVYCPKDYRPVAWCPTPDISDVEDLLTNLPEDTSSPDTSEEVK